MSLDGYIADADHGLEWLEKLPNPDGSDFGFEAHMASIDVVVMGRGTFDVVKDFRPWPYDKPVVVVSSTLTETPADIATQVRIVQGTPAEVVAICNEEGLRHLYVDGGKLVTAFLEAGLIDKLTISTLPVTLGAGIRLFGEMSKTTWWTHDATTSYGGGMVQSIYLAEPTSSD